MVIYNIYDNNCDSVHINILFKSEIFQLGCNIWIKIVNSKCDYMWALVQWKSIWSKASCKCWMSGNFGAWQMNRRIGRFNLTKHLNSRRRGFWKIWPDLWMRDKFPAFYPLVKSRGAMGRPLINRYKCHTLYAQCYKWQPFHESVFADWRGGTLFWVDGLLLTVQSNFCSLEKRLKKYTDCTSSKSGRDNTILWYRLVFQIWRICLIWGKLFQVWAKINGLRGWRWKFLIDTIYGRKWLKVGESFLHYS